MSETTQLTLTDFLLARIAEDEAEVTRWQAAMEADEIAAVGVPAWVVMAGGLKIPRHVLAECEAKRRIIEFHQSWPVLVESPPDFDFGVQDGTIEATTLGMSKRIAWLTEQEYRAKFGTEPPTAPMLSALAAVYADHPDYRDEWRP